MNGKIYRLSLSFHIITPNFISGKMLRSNAFKSSRRLLATVTESKAAKPTTKAWAKSSEELQCYKISHQPSRNTVLDGVSEFGPPSLGSRRGKDHYMSPLGLNEAFDVAYDILKTKANEKYQELNEINQQLSQNPNSKELKDLKIKKSIEAEINNPEVQFNFQYHDKVDNNPKIIDYNQPVYRELKQKHWESHDQMLLMQRLEQLGCIPDTLPTLDPKAEVLVKFLNHTTVNRWIEPGTFLSSNTTTYPPSIKVQEYESVDVENQLYTVLLVNPDVPCLETDSFKTHIQWGLTNVKLSYNDNLIGPNRLLSDESINELIDYLPPVPEKNIPTQRFITWVFRQPEPINEKIEDREFAIRQYVEDHKLEAIGAHVWRSEWDTNVAKVRELYGLPKGTVFHRVRAPL